MTDFKPHPDLPPPITEVGVIGWLRRNLFSDWLNTGLTLLAIYLIYIMIPPLLDWALIKADWVGDSAKRVIAVAHAGCLSTYVSIPSCTASTPRLNSGE